MRKEAFLKYVKRLALLTEHQRVVLAQALMVSHTGTVSGLLDKIGERPAACPHCQAGGDGLHPWGQSHPLLGWGQRL